MKSMKKLLTRLSKSRYPYEPLIRVEISRSRLLHNLSEFRKLAPGGQIAPVLKSNAYGHGLFEIAGLLEAENHSKTSRNSHSIPFFVVDSYFEAVALRAHRIRTPLLIIGYSRPEMILNSSLKDVAFAITTLETLREINTAPKKRFRKPISIHLKIDTGMHRQGILREEIPQAIRLIKNSEHLVLEGICSHLPDADNLQTEYTDKQIIVWNEIAALFKKEFSLLKYIHLANTDGHLFHSKIDANVSRLGIGLYGLAENPKFTDSFNISPVLEMKTIITSVKELEQGDTIGYSNTFTVPQTMKVATIPAGYFEGIDRRLSNKGYLQVGATRTLCPIVGRVSMNITSIDVSKVDAKIGTEVVVISNNPDNPNSINGIVRASQGTIAYELAVHVPPHLKRIVVD